MKSAERLWVENWLVTGPLLEAIRNDELRSMTQEGALRASEAVLDLAGRGWRDPAKDPHSGLVEQQALLQLLRR